MEVFKTAKIKVERLRFQLKKGLYETEKQLENSFCVSAEVSYRVDAIAPGEYLNYEVLAGICRRQMLRETHLLEHIAAMVLDDIAAEWPFFTTASVRIEKLNPAFEGLDIGAVVVELHAENPAD